MFKFTTKLSFLGLIALFYLSPNISAQQSKNEILTPQKNILAPQTGSQIKIENEIFDEINLLRSDPKSYAKLLEEMKRAIKDNIVSLSNGSMWKMNEGLPAIDDAINALNKTAKLKPFIFSKGLSKVAGIQLADLQENMSLGHFGKDGSDIENRLYKIGTPGEKYSENIAYFSKDALSVVLTMIIDDGLKSRSHRKNLLAAQFNEIGIAYGKGKNNVGLCVIVFADRFAEKGKK